MAIGGVDMSALSFDTNPSQANTKANTKASTTPQADETQTTAATQPIQTATNTTQQTTQTTNQNLQTDAANIQTGTQTSRSGQASPSSTAQQSSIPQTQTSQEPHISQASNTSQKSEAQTSHTSWSLVIFGFDIASFFRKLFGSKTWSQQANNSTYPIVDNTINTKKTAKTSWFGFGSTNNNETSKQEQYADDKAEQGKLSTIMTSVSAIAVFVIILFGVMTIYHMTASPQPVNPSYVSYHQTYEEYESLVSDYLPLSDYNMLASLPFGGSIGRSNISQVIGSDKLSYVQRKRLMQMAVDQSAQSLIDAYRDLDLVKQQNATFGFFHPELYEIMDGDSSASSIQRSLLSLETIRFATAIKVFSHLDTFLDQFSRNARISRAQTEDMMQTIIARAEKDISYYLQACYLNPFETNERCHIINDFDAYYQVIEEDAAFDTDLFKELLAFIDNKLEDSQYPSLMMTFDNFDPRSQQLTFTVTVNSFQDDEVELFRKGILNPHIFIVSNIVNLLKQSTFVLGEFININQLDIDKQEVEVGNTTIRMSRSEMRFDLPLQKETQREITDYITSLPTQRERPETPSLSPDPSNTTDNTPSDWAGSKDWTDWNNLATSQDQTEGEATEEITEGKAEEVDDDTSSTAWLDQESINDVPLLNIQSQSLDINSALETDARQETATEETEATQAEQEETQDQAQENAEDTPLIPDTPWWTDGTDWTDGVGGTNGTWTIWWWAGWATWATIFIP